MIILNIDVTKIPKERIETNPKWKGKFLKLALRDNKEGRDEKGSDGFIVIDLPREQRDAGQRGEIVGNWKDTANNTPKPQQRTPPPRPQPKPADPDLDAPEEDDVPF